MFQRVTMNDINHFINGKKTMNGQHLTKVDGITFLFYI